jgi:valyl-tRNA synthetase
MRGYNVFYPMGYDDNGLPTERLVERKLGIKATERGRGDFIETCLRVSEEMAQEYQALWERLGLSIDWRYTYRTIDKDSQRTSQLSFLDLYHKGRAYRQEAPTIWCPECGTAIAQADLDDLERTSAFYTLAFAADGGTLDIATTRPELLPACVAVFVHPGDERYQHLVGGQARVPHFGQKVPILEDPAADPEKGTGAVMCCTFGDVTDIAWWYTHKLPLRVALDRTGRMTDLAGEFAGLPAVEARKRIVEALDAARALLDQYTVRQSVRVHERCDTPVEYVVGKQWFVRVLDRKDDLLAAGARVRWYPEHMQVRYREWVENLNWDWCISRQRFYGVPFPVWYCDACGEVVVASETELPVDPTERRPKKPCTCGSTEFRPELDVQDTWATSSLTPQIAGQWLADPALYEVVYPFSLRPQAHEIIRTWAFYTIVKSLYHFGAVPWQDAAISGWGLAPKGAGKISKSRGGGPASPQEMIERYSADAIRYWAAGTGLGKDTLISEDRIRAGARLVTKLWNVARFSVRFLEGYHPPVERPALSPADRWILSRTQRLIRRATAQFEAYEFAPVTNQVEAFLWNDLADNYLEMVKRRLYGDSDPAREGSRYALYQALLATVKLLAPILPFVTEEIYQKVFAPAEGAESIHCSAWPVADDDLEDDRAERVGEALVGVASAVRRYKTEQALHLSAEPDCLQLATADADLLQALREAESDVMGITRAQRIEVRTDLDPTFEPVGQVGSIAVAVRADPGGD